MMGKIAGNREIAFVNRFTAGVLQTFDHLNCPVSLGIVFVARDQRPTSERNS
jgi:hypothetical protein